jgi:hypothetical protein
VQIFSNHPLDDLILFSSSFDQHLHDLNECLTRLVEANVYLNPKKCRLFEETLIYLGHEVSARGIRPHPAKLSAIKLMKERNSKSPLKSFLGLCGDYLKFIKNFSIKAQSLSYISQEKIQYTWTTDLQNAFETLKEQLCSRPLL